MPHLNASHLLVMLLIVLSTLSQTRAMAQPVFDPPDPAGVKLEPEAIDLEGIGIRLRPPLGHERSTNSVDGRITTSISLPGELGVISIQLHGDPAAPSLLELEERVIEDILGLPEETTGLTIDTQIESGNKALLGRSPTITIRDRLLRPFYFKLGVFQRDIADTRRIRGVAILPMTATDYALISLVTREQWFDEAREIFEVMLSTITLADFASMDEQRGIAVEGGIKAIGSLSTSDYDSVITDIPEQFERIYRPAPGGAASDEAEVGYRRIRSWIGPRTDMTTREPSPNRTTLETDGYLLRIDGLVFLDDGKRADSRAIYYLSRDRRQEAWTVEMAIRDTRGGKPEVWTEIGARSGRHMTVQISSGGKASHTARPLIEGEGYVSRLESYLLPELLIRAEAEGEFAFYAYDQAAESNRIRFVTMSRPSDRPDAWTAVTRRVNDQADTATYNAFGRLIKSESSDGLIKRPIEFQRLFRLWESKGLPLD